MIKKLREKEMKMIKKKWKMSFLALFNLSASPIITIACQSTDKFDVDKFDVDKDDNLYAKQYYRPFQFNEIRKYGKGQPIMDRGLGYDSYSHGMSFIWNVMRKLGFDIFQNQIQVRDNRIIGIKYHKKENGKWTQNDFKNSQENPEIIFKMIENIRKNKNAKYKRNDNFIGNHSVDPLGVDGPVGIYTIYRSGYSGRIFWDINNNKTWEKIIDLNNESINNESKKFNWHLLPDLKKIAKESKPEISKIIYAMPNYFEMIDGDKPKPEKAHIDEGGKTILITEVQNYQPLNNDFTKVIIGSKKIQEEIEKNKKWSFNYAFVSEKNFSRGYQIIKKPEKIKEIKMLVTAIIKNIHYFLNKNNRLKVAINPILKKMLQFLKNLPMNEKTLKDIHQAVEELNNGTHNMFAVEIFARGVENVPLRYMPVGVNANGIISINKKMRKSNLGWLTGIANTLDAGNIINWVHTTKKNYADENGDISTKDWEVYNPDSGKQMSKDNRKKIKKFKRLGREVPLMGGIVNRAKYNKWSNKYNKWVKEKSKDDSNNIKEPIFNEYLNKEYLL